MLKRKRRHPCLTLTVVLNHSLNCTYSIVVQVLNGANKICIDTVFPHGADKVTCHTLSNTFEIYEDMVQILLMLKVGWLVVLGLAAL